jgi:hypothetical protein
MTYIIWTSLVPDLVLAMSGTGLTLGVAMLLLPPVAVAVAVAAAEQTARPKSLG